MESFFKLIKEENLIEKGDNILVALSGGPDSVALARLLLKIKEEYTLTLGFCHINHMLRGENSDGDEKFCKEFSENYQIPFYSLKAEVEAYGKSNKIGLEEAGREIRYDFFEKISKENFYNKIALAHNLDDNVETFLFRLIRGTGINGLKGIPVKRDKIIRPLLSTKKEEIYTYLNSLKQNYRVDESNNEKLYTRNKIRLELIPYLEKEFNIQVKDSINELIKDFKLIGNNAKIAEKQEILLEDLIKLSDAERNNVIYSFLRHNKIEVSRKKVEEVKELIEKDGYKELNLGKDKIIKKTYKTIGVFSAKKEEIKKSKIRLEIPSKIGYNGYIIEVELSDKINKSEDCFNFDYDKIKFPLYIRTKDEGDKFLPKGMNNYKKLKKFFIDEKIDKEKREEIPLIISGDEILLVGNLRKSSIGELSEESNKILLIKVKEGVFDER